MKNRRVVLIVADSCGVGGAPDAASYDDEGADTLGHIAAAVGRLRLPELQRLGLGNLTDIDGVPPAAEPAAAYGRMQERSAGKDTTSGHWEIAGLFLEEGFKLFPPGPPAFPDALVAEVVAGTGRRIIGNRAASGTQIIEELGEQHIREGSWIAYTSADSVFQVAAHEEVIPLEELYAGCKVVRKLCNPYQVGRVIARPFVGKPGAFTRTQNRRDFSYPLPEPTILDRLFEKGIRVTTVGKLDDVYANSGISQSVHVENNPDAQAAVLELAAGPREGLVFANLIDFDMLYGHRRNPDGYARCLEAADAFLAELQPRLGGDDVVMITADHGNDPTYKGTDHTREYVPLLVYGPSVSPGPLGIRNGFYDIAQSLATLFGLPPMPRGRSFL